jgi:adenylate cyclase
MQAFRPERTRLSHLLLIALAAAALVTIGYLAPAEGPGQGANLLDRLEYRTVDWRFWIRGSLTPDPRLVILEVDDTALERVGKWPWPRQTWARVTELLLEAGARPIVFDIFFPEREPAPAATGVAPSAVERGLVPRPLGSTNAAAAPEGQRIPFDSLSPGDQALVRATATKRAYTVYHAAFASALGEGAGGARLPEALMVPATIVPGHGFDAGASLGTFQNILAGFPELTAAASGVGFADVLDAGDGIFRYVLPVARVGEQTCPSLALRVARDLLAPGEQVTVELGREVRVGQSLRVPIDRAGRMAINFAGPARTYPRRNVADLLEGKLPDDVLTGKIVVIAATAPGLHDLRASPYGAIFDGAEAQANILDNMLTGRYLRELPPEKVVFLMAAMALLTALAFWAMRPLYAFLGAAALLLGYEAVAVWAFGARGLVLPVFLPGLSLVLGVIGLLVYGVLHQERATRTAYRTLGRYVAGEVVRRLAETEEEVAQGVRRTATILFSDLRNFTGSTARLQPEEVVSLLNRYFSLMYETLTEYEGTLDKYMGDGLMAYFLATEGDSEHAVLAVQAALEMQRRIEVNRDEWAFYGMPDLRAGIGIATGEEILGDIGSPDRMQYTLVGPEVNLAARLVELTKTVGADIIMDERTYRLAKDYIAARCLGPVRLHGLEEAQIVYEALPDGPGAE